jgi:uncharacterized repeat protein (TIGR01451 family)
MPGWLTARRQRLLPVAGTVLCVAVAPVTALVARSGPLAITTAAASGCSTRAPGTVTYAVNGIQVSTLAGHVEQGDEASASFTVPAGCTLQLSLVAYTAPSGVFDGTTILQQRVYGARSGTFGPGRHSLSVRVPACFFQLDFVHGPVITTFGPPGSGNYYTNQGRLISSAMGGSTSCASRPLATLTVHILRQGTAGEVSGGAVTIDAAGGPLTSPNPVVGAVVASGRAVAVAAAAPAGWRFVNNPAQPDVITGAGTAARLAGGIVVPPARAAEVDFYVVPIVTPPLAAHLTLTKTVDPATTVVGGTVTYVVTLANTGGKAAGNVTVQDVLTGTAGFRVNDGTNGTANSFAGAPLTTVYKFGDGLYRWSYASVNPGEVNVVRFAATLRLPPVPLVNATVITLVNAATIPGLPAAVATTTAPYGGGAQPGGVQAASVGTPATGGDVQTVAAGFLFLGGLGMILLGSLARRRDEEYGHHG